MFSRIMAPIGQSEKFDAGDYIRRWVPGLYRQGPSGGSPDGLVLVVRGAFAPAGAKRC